MDKIFIALEGTMDELSSRLQGERVFDERLSIERSKVKSLEQEIDQLRLQVSLLQSKVRMLLEHFELIPNHATSCIGSSFGNKAA